MSDLALTCAISVGGGSLDLESGPYSLERTALEEIGVVWRKQETSNPWVEGTYVIGAVRELIALPLLVYVAADTEAFYKAAQAALVAALEQLSFTLTFGQDGVSTTWRCQVADYTVRREQGLRYSHQGLVKATVPAFPAAIA